MKIYSIQNNQINFKSKESYHKLFSKIFEQRFYSKNDIYNAFTKLKAEVETIPDTFKVGSDYMKKMDSDFWKFFTHQRSLSPENEIPVVYSYEIPEYNVGTKYYVPAEMRNYFELINKKNINVAIFSGFYNHRDSYIAFGLDESSDIFCERNDYVTYKKDIYYKEENLTKPRVSVDYFEACNKINYLERYDKSGQKISNFHIYLKKELKSFGVAYIRALRHLLLAGKGEFW